MTTIWLGEGADAVEVEYGTSVPLVDRKTRGVVICVAAVGCPLLQIQNTSVWYEVHAHTGRLVGPDWVDGIEVAIDLAALRRERAPKAETVGGWAYSGDFKHRNYQNLNAYPQCGGDRYWTHRPGNTPEKQAAFDAALEAWIRDTGPWADTYDPPNRLVTTARALGYGKR